MRFEWDETKANANLEKHAISFHEATSVFFDPPSATGADPDHSLDEHRYVTFGMSAAGRLLAVAHADREDSIRIISAREVTKAERKLYESA